MKHGFIKIAAATPKILVANSEHNGKQIVELIEIAEMNDVKVLLLPELCLSGYTCGELFLQDILLKSVEKELIKIVSYTLHKDVLVTVGLPLCKDGKLYNVAAVIQNGSILGFVPKTNLPNYSEFYETRHFNIGNEIVQTINFNNSEIPFGTNLLFKCKNMDSLVLGVEICEDLWVPISPSAHHALAGATIILNPSASDENTGKDEFRLELIKNHSAKLVCGYVYADAGEGESTTDLVFAGHNIIAENGTILKTSTRFKNEMIITEIDVNKLMNERRRMTTYKSSVNSNYKYVDFSYNHIDNDVTTLTRTISKSPFVPSVKGDRDKRCEEIILIQAYGLKKRLEHIGINHVTLGISGGLDSTLALLVTCKTFDLLNMDRKGIITVTMPCFGTTDRTYQNALSLAKLLGTTLMEIPIRDSVLMHFKDINHDKDVHDLTFENSQARERTQVLMDLATKYNGIVIGTGDMSELALGWATYNGDHMSMYGVNASIPKTLIRYLVSYFAETMEDEKLQKVLFDILDTPVSPELLPPVNGQISQKTEDLVGPYELHDFFLYYVLRFGFMPSKVYHLAIHAFHGEYEEEVMLKWLKIFYKRFFYQQFKRSCIPDGPKVGSVALSPRGDLRMPSDASVSLWLNDLETITIKEKRA
jgi:NAD+ synthase (glutamine-hydrolysing)